jgi:hypothetical protein
MLNVLFVLQCSTNVYNSRTAQGVVIFSIYYFFSAQAGVSYEMLVFSDNAQ